MEQVLPVLVILAMAAVLGVLALGIFTLAKGGDPRRSGKLMQWRVVMQGLAVAIFVLFMLLFRR
jgi:ABC-type Na+ efflux pump permease subunit